MDEFHPAEVIQNLKILGIYDSKTGKSVLKYGGSPLHPEYDKVSWIPAEEQAPV